MLGCCGRIPLTGPQVEDRAGDDVVRADLDAVALVFPAAELAFDVDLCALLEASGVFGQLAPAGDAVPFDPLLAVAVLQVLQKSATGVFSAR